MPATLTNRTRTRAPLSTHRALSSRRDSWSVLGSSVTRRQAPAKAHPWVIAFAINSFYTDSPVLDTVELSVQKRAQEAAEAERTPTAMFWRIYGQAVAVGVALVIMYAAILYVQSMFAIGAMGAADGAATETVTETAIASEAVHSGVELALVHV